MTLTNEKCCNHIEYFCLHGIILLVKIYYLELISAVLWGNIIQKIGTNSLSEFCRENIE